MFLTFQQKVGKCAFVYHIEFVKAVWSCSWNSDQNCNKSVSSGLQGDGYPGAGRVQGGGTFKF